MRSCACSLLRGCGGLSLAADLVLLDKQLHKAALMLGGVFGHLPEIGEDTGGSVRIKCAILPVAGALLWLPQEWRRYACGSCLQACRCWYITWRDGARATYQFRPLHLALAVFGRLRWHEIPPPLMFPVMIGSWWFSNSLTPFSGGFLHWWQWRDFHKSESLPITDLYFPGFRGI